MNTLAELRRRNILFICLYTLFLTRWNKLDFDGYDSIDSKSGEALPVAMKHERPFWFSKVRSYV